MAKDKSAKTDHQETHDGDNEQFQPRPFWSGVIAFGLVSLPVSLFPANRSKGNSLKMVDREGSPLKRRFYCERDGEILEREDVVRGFPLDKEHFVLVDDEELEALAPDKSREIDLRRFVPLEQINPIFFQRGYFLAPDSGAHKAYRLLAKSMEEEQRAGVATFVMRDKEYIIAIMAEHGILRAETLRFSDEIRSPEQIGLPALPEADSRQVESLRQALESVAADTLDISLLEDQDTRRLRELAESKLDAGDHVMQEPEVAEPTEEANVIDLMEVLKARLKGKSAPEDEQAAPKKDATS
ncbi:Ku protein [Marinimicrobium sp. ABcell2]|uniref:non-homologous end joining protein Ku n=1 Tax=Marinimicrobium sp. ABcell2 TaxID=3069751 RepID=UPI0027AF3640|nr:Ku protein [Marinimicrobium sp. ABcell2]MDQ2077573.1 Ku protein [Marinimicrobium sp. ABcell2]